MEATQTQSETVLWRQVWGLALLQAAIALSWQIYSAAQPVILAKFDLLAVLAPLSLVPGLLSLGLDPLFGQFNDYIKQRVGSRLPAINIGAQLTSLIFLTVALSLQTNILLNFRWLIPGLMIGWVTTMKIFQNPSVSLVKQYAPPKDLPQAAAILTVVGTSISALRPFAKMLVTQFGASLTFALGGVVLMTALTVLQRLTPKTVVTVKDTSVTKLSRWPLLFVFGTGVGVQLALGTLGATVLANVQSQWPTINFEWIASSFLIVSGLAALPLGQWIKRFGVERALWVGLLGTLGLMTLTLVNGNIGLALGLLLGGGVIQALLFTVGVPLTFAYAPATQASLALGLFFGGGGLAATFFAIFKVLYGDLPIALTWLITGLAVGLAGLCVEGLKRSVR